MGNSRYAQYVYISEKHHNFVTPTKLFMIDAAKLRILFRLIMFYQLHSNK